MKMKQWTRRLAGLLVAAMLLSCLPLAAFAAGTTTVAKAQLGTNKDYDGEKVDLSNALYTFDLVDGSIYKIHNDTTAGKTVYPTGTASGVTHTTAETSIEVTPATVGNTSYFRLNAAPTGNNHIVFVGETWTNARDNIKLMFNRANNLNLYTEANKTTYVPCMEFALYEQSENDADSEIPGYELATEITDGGEYLIAQKSGDTWYVMYPYDGGSGYNHVAKVVIEEGQEPEPTPEPTPDPTDPPEPTKPEKPTVDAEHDLYQVEIMCEVDHAHYWTYPSTVGWAHSSPDQFTVGEVRENDLNNGTAEEYPYICPVTPAYTLDECVAKVDTVAPNHRAITTEETIPVAYYYWNATDGWALLRGEANPNVRFSSGQFQEGTLEIKVTCADTPDQPDPPTPEDPEKPTAKPAVGNAVLYQVDILCQKHLDQDPDCTDHWWSQAETAAAFTVGDIQANHTGYLEDTCDWVCPVTPAHDLAYYLTQLNNKCSGHTLVSTELPTAWFFWNGTAWTLPKEANDEVRFGANDVGSLSIYATCGETPDEPDPPTPVDPDKPGAPTGQPTGEYTMPSDKLSGTGSTEPMSDADVSSYFRIPALVTLSNGWIVAASDARWTNSNDSPNNLDTIVSVSKDGGATWDWEIINYFADFAPIQGPTYYPGTSKTASASFIDPALTVDGSGKIWMLVDMLPSYGGNAGGNKMVASTGFDSQGRLLISHGTADGNASGNAADYTYCVDLNVQPSKTAQKNGKSVGLYPIQARSGGGLTGYYVDAFMDLWYDYENDGGVKPVLCRQKESSHYVQNNVFYQQSEWKVICTFYIMARSAQVDEQSGRLVWSDPKLLNVKNAGERFTAVCPGRGTIVTVDGKERLMFQLYDNSTGAEQASTVYSDDGGKTWTRGERTAADATAGKASESQIVHLPNGDLRMYSRNDKNFIRYADSADGGVTWGAAKLDNALAYCGNDMVSFINVDGVLVGPDNKTYENVILASYAKESYRSSGVIRIGYINDDAGQTVTWLNNDAIRFPGRYNYSCLTQLPDHAGFAVLYEQDDTSNPAKGVMAMHFVKFTAADLLGEGWLLTAAKPTEAVTLKVDSSLIDLNFGGSRTVAAEYTPEDAVVTWTSADESVVTVQDGVITAVGTGKTTVTVSVTKGSLTRTATIPVMVQPESGELILPEQYVDSVATVVTPGVTQYVLDEDGEIDDVPYIIYAASGNRVIHNNTQKNATDHCTPSMSGDKAMNANHAADARWQPTDDLWKLVKQEDGSFFIQSETNDKYITATASGSQLAIGDAGAPFTITHQGEGVYHVKNGDNFLAFSGGWRLQSDAFEIRLFGKLTTQDTTTYTVSANGLKALIRAAGMDAADYADALAAEGEYDDEADAQAALALINAAAQEVYAQLREGNITRYLVTYTVEGELLAVQSYYPGEIIVPMTDPVREGQIFTGWTGMPADKIMPDHDLALEAAFRPVGTGGSSSGGGSSRPNNPSRPADEDLNEPDVPLVDAPITFVDVAEDAWYAEAVAAMAAKGLVKGVGEDRFAPDASMTRASLAEVLYRLSGSEEKETAPFADVAEDIWYAGAVAWAAKNGVVTGISDDTFAPDRTITRQELAAMLARYAAFAGLDTATDPAALRAFADGETVDSWATDGAAWCVAQGILRGKGGDVLDPTAEITRAEVVTMLDRFIALLK